MLADDLMLAVCLRVGDAPKARDMIREGRTGGMSPSDMLRHAVRGDRPGVARMLAGENALDVSRIECDDALLGTCNVVLELLACGLRPPSPVTPLERALSCALFDARSSLAAAGVMMQAAGRRPDLYERMLSVADMGPSGPELLHQAVRACEQAETAGTPATR